MIKGWTGKRLRIDLSLQKAWSEEIIQGDLLRLLGGRGLNASVLALPGLLTFAPLFTNNLESFAAVLAMSSASGVVFERILFFRLEQPVFFLSRGQNPEPKLQKSAVG